MYYEFQGHERRNTMGDIDHKHFKFPAQIWYPFQEDEIDIYQKLFNFEVPNCYTWLGSTILLTNKEDNNHFGFLMRRLLTIESECCPSFMTYVE